MKAAFLKVLRSSRAVIALLVALVALAATFAIEINSDAVGIVVVAAWIGGLYTFFKALFEVHAEQLASKNRLTRTTRKP